VKYRRVEILLDMETVTVVEEELTTQKYVNMTLITAEEINSFYFYEVSWQLTIIIYVFAIIHQIK